MTRDNDEAPANETGGEGTGEQAGEQQGEQAGEGSEQSEFDFHVDVVAVVVWG